MFLEASCLSMFITSHPSAAKVDVSWKLLHQSGFPGTNGSSVAALQALLHLACVSWGNRGDLITPLIIPAQAVLSLQDVPGPLLRLAGKGQLAPPLTVSFCPQAPAQQPDPKPGSQRL